jgi:hypothetical protein
MSSIENIAQAVPSDVKLADAERKAVVEIAYLAVASDHDVNEQEEAALRSIAKKLGGEKDVDPIIKRMSGPIAREIADARLQELAKLLPAYEARVVAYKAAYAVALSDLASSDEEFEFDLQLIDALGLPQSEADRLAEEVMQAIQPA